MIGLESGKVQIAQYDPAWKDAFRSEGEELRAALKDIASTVVIEHVGSTAVDGLASKPIIDIVLGFRSLRDLHRGLELLVGSGRDYVKAANQPGMLFMAKGEEGRRNFHYHLVVYGTPAWRKLLVFRDYLRRHPGAASEYGRLKTELASENPESRAKYMARKRPALRAIMQRGFAENARRRQAASIALSLSMADEERALGEWRRLRDLKSAEPKPENYRLQSAAIAARQASDAEQQGAIDPLDPDAEA
jgi:GrpB-like predicted nucleotidyltransferase (UPF0157 family)